ncbi:MAG: cellulase family glycosylhydrolase [Acidiferrobacteraceae bacterium]
MATRHGHVVTLIPTKTITWRHFLGVNAQLLWFKPKTYIRQLDALKALGLDWVRVDLHWDILEPARHYYRHVSAMDTMIRILKQKHFRSVLYLTGSTPFDTRAPSGARHKDQYPPRHDRPFADFMARLAKRYPSVNAWQVWNEPNLPSFWRPGRHPARSYGRLLAMTTHAIRAVAPGKTVVMGGMGYYSQMPERRNTLMLKRLGEMGAFGLGVVVAYHPYTEYPEGDNPRKDDFLKHANLLNAALRSAGVKSIWADEWGWSSYRGPREMQAIIGRRGQADYVLRRLALMSTMDYNRIFLFTLSDLDHRATVRDRSYGLLNLKGRPKPVYLALRQFLTILGPTIYPAPPLAVITRVPRLYSITWRRPDGRDVWLFWGSSDGSALVHAPGGRLHDPLTGSVRTLQPTKEGTLRVPVRTSLQMLTLP